MEKIRIKEFLQYQIKKSTKRIKVEEEILSNCKNLLNEIDLGTLTTGDIKVALKHFKGHVDLYPSYKNTRAAFRVYNLLHKK